MRRVFLKCFTFFKEMKNIGLASKFTGIVQRFPVKTISQKFYVTNMTRFRVVKFIVKWKKNPYKIQSILLIAKIVGRREAKNA